MEINIQGDPGFRYLQLALDPGDELIAESDAMASMDTEVGAKPRLNGGLVGGIVRKLFVNESMFVNHFSNPTNERLRLTITNPLPGDIIELKLNNESYGLQPGAFLCSTSGIKRQLRWAGFASFIGGEGLFKLEVSGTGSVFVGCYGALKDKDLVGEYIVDTGHLVAYPPSVKMKVQFSNGIFGSFFSGEGLVSRVEGEGKIYIQTRSLDGFSSWLNPRL